MSGLLYQKLKEAIESPKEDEKNKWKLVIEYCDENQEKLKTVTDFLTEFRGQLYSLRMLLCDNDSLHRKVQRALHPDKYGSESKEFLAKVTLAFQIVNNILTDERFNSELRAALEPESPSPVAQPPAHAERPFSERAGAGGAVEVDGGVHPPVGSSEPIYSRGNLQSIIFYAQKIKRVFKTFRWWLLEPESISVLYGETNNNISIRYKKAGNTHKYLAFFRDDFVLLPEREGAVVECAPRMSIGQNITLKEGEELFVGDLGGMVNLKNEGGVLKASTMTSCFYYSEEFQVVDRSRALFYGSGVGSTSESSREPSRATRRSAGATRTSMPSRSARRRAPGPTSTAFYESATAIDGLFNALGSVFASFMQGSSGK